MEREEKRATPAGGSVPGGINRMCGQRAEYGPQRREQRQRRERQRSETRGGGAGRRTGGTVMQRILQMDSLTLYS